MKLFLALRLAAVTLVLSGAARAATLTSSPRAPQPGDIVTLTVTPKPGEKLTAIGMSAFDTAEVKFFSKSNGSARAFVGLPFDRKGGDYTLTARIQTDMGEQNLSVVVHAATRVYPTQRIRMSNRATAAKMDDKASLAAEKARVRSKMTDSYAAPLWSGAWLRPCRGQSTSSYGRRRYVNGKWWGQHNGADIKASGGTPVQAANSGRVVLSEYLPVLRGNCVVVDHGCNIFSIYMHLSRRDVREGDTVSKGQVVGLVGATGFVTGPHLHWEVRVGWEPVDPQRVVDRGVSF